MRYIDADAMKKDLEENYVFVGFADLLNDIVEVIDAQPTADVVERKKGEWVDAWRSAFDGTKHWHRECSECGYERDDDNIDKDTKFCPNCGAEMKGEEE